MTSRRASRRWTIRIAFVLFLSVLALLLASTTTDTAGAHAYDLRAPNALTRSCAVEAPSMTQPDATAGVLSTGTSPIMLVVAAEGGTGSAPGSYLAGKAPLQVEPGVTSLSGQYVNDLGRVEPWTAHYDQYGRLIGRTDYNAGNIADGIPDIHYHTYGWGISGTRSESSTDLDTRSRRVPRMTGVELIRSYHLLTPRECAILEELTIGQSSEPWELDVILVTRDEMATRRIRLEFRGVTDLSLDWRQRSGLELDVISISDLTDAGMEDLNYRVSEGEGLFAFYCRDISVTDTRLVSSSVRHP